MTETKFKTQSIQDANITGAKLASEAWTDYVPTTTGITKGNATLVARYVRIGKFIAGTIQFVLGNTSSITGAISFTVPVTPCGPCSATSFFIDAGNTYFATVTFVESGIINIDAINTSSTYGSRTQTSSTIPFTWTTNDQIICNFFYEAA